MTQQLSSVQTADRVAGLATMLGNLDGVSHANVLAQAFSPEALERALNLSFSRELGAFIPALLSIYKFFQAQSSRFGVALVPGIPATGRAYGTLEFPAFAVAHDELTYMVLLEPLPPVVRQAYPDMQQWAVHLRACVRSSTNGTPTSPDLASLQFLGEFKNSADRPVPKRQTYFREWDHTDRGFVASTEPTTGPEAWTPADVTRGLGAETFRAVMSSLRAVEQATQVEVPAKPSTQNTLLQLSYRDAGNFKRYMEEVLEGAITPEQVLQLGSALNDGYQLIADQVGLPTPSFEAHDGEDDWPSKELDHVWTVLNAFEEGTPLAESLHTDRAPTLAMTVVDFVHKVTNRAKAWDIEAEWARMESAAAWNSRNPDSTAVLRVLPRAA